LTTDRGDPLLAHWQYGLGRVVAWTSDVQSAWAGSWLDSADARRVFGQAVRWSMPQPTDAAFQLTASADEDRVTIRVVAQEGDGRFADRREIRTIVTTPDRSPIQVPLRQVGPGTYEAAVQATRPGAYAVQAQEMRNGSPARSESGGFVVTPNAELRTVGPNRPLLEQLAQMSGGRELTTPADMFERDNVWHATRWQPLWPWLLGLALLLLPLDVAARRLALFRR
jgi:hypothetical protein